MKELDIIDAAPAACRLTTAERPTRIAEFDALFAAALAVDRTDDVTLQAQLPPESAGQAADLAARESACCSFFTFQLRITGGEVELVATVPPAYAEVIGALAGRYA